MTTLQQEARALGDPTRHAIFRYLADADEPVDIAELTSHFELNHNAIRQHLGKLLDAGLVVEARVQGGGPGRPRLVYEIHPGAESRWGVVGPYERLSLLLAEIIRTGDAPIAVGRRVAKEFRTSGDPDDILHGMTDTMARLGFEPEIQRRGNRVELVLGTCPFATTAVADPGTVCSLHLGLVEGLAEGTEIVIDELVAKDPRRARCRLRLHIEPDES